MSDELNLVLIQYLYDEVGVKNRDNPFNWMKDIFSDYEEEFDSGIDGEAGHTKYLEASQTAFSSGNSDSQFSGKNMESNLSKDDILRYDSNIEDYLNKINDNRDSILDLRYYQYLALFFNEIYLDKLSSNSEKLKRELNAYIQNDFIGEENPLQINQTNELHKIAYWMATGSGKTYVAHLNYHQFDKYIGLDEFDEVILIAPKEQIARQHVQEFRKNGIDASRINNSEHSDVLVTDFDKLDKDASGPKTVNVSEYQGKNLVFVDEGHKGLGGRNSSGTGWKEMRDTLAGLHDDGLKSGYMIEYSATYGSAIKEAEGYQEYSTSILFDYPYGRYHEDEYGKDYKILNINATSDERDLEQWKDKRKEWLLINTLSYYEKLSVFAENPNLRDEHNMKKPLSVFAGGSVNTSRSGGESTDVQLVVEFIDELLHNESWAIEVIQDVLNNNTAVQRKLDILDSEFTHLIGSEMSAEELYADMISKLFDADKTQTLTIHQLNNDDGEIGLKTQDSESYFGLISIGDDGDFIEMLQESDYERINIESLNTYTGRLFDDIDTENSNIRFLIGSRKFTEGWNSVRPANMGLLNLGQSKGPSTVQLFGRGVRVNGKENDGKRSTGLSTKDKVSTIETLHVFGVRAKYIEEFKNSLEEERVNTDITNITVDVENDSSKVENKGLKRPVTSTESKDIEVRELEEFIGNKIPTVNLSYEVSGITREEDSEELYDESSETSARSVNIVNELQFNGSQLDIEVLDWDRIYEKVLKYKSQKENWDIIITKESIKKLIESEKNYELNIDPDRLNISSLNELSDIEDICATVIKNQVKIAYQEMLSNAEEETIELVEVDSSVKNEDIQWIEDVVPEEFHLKINEKKASNEVIEQLKEVETLDELEGELDNLTSTGNYVSEVLKFLHHHQYRPIAVSSNDDEIDIDYLDSVHPQGLNNGELIFIEQLDEYLNTDIESDLDESIEYTLALRNPSNTGIGFNSAGGFYPDFVIWIKTNSKQHIIFADPKGMMNTTSGTKEKVKFGRKIRNLSSNLDTNVEMHSYIVARTDGEGRSEQKIFENWCDTLRGIKEFDYNGGDSDEKELLNDANVYLQTGSTDTVKKIIQDAINQS